MGLTIHSRRRRGRVEGLSVSMVPVLGKCILTGGHALPSPSTINRCPPNVVLLRLSPSLLSPLFPPSLLHRILHLGLRQGGRKMVEQAAAGTLLIGSRS